MRPGRPSFQSNVESPQGIPHVINVRAILPGNQRNYDELRIAGLLASHIRDLVRTSAARYTRWSSSRINSRINGFLTATNLNNATVHTFDELTHLRDLTGQVILDVMEKLQRSEVDVSIFQLEWRFTINPNSLIAGGNRDVRMPQYCTPHDYRDTWEHHMFEQHHVGCAAFALNRLLKKYIHVREKKCALDALTLQRILGWEEEITFHQFWDFVEKFPTYKIVVMVAGIDRAFQKFKGVEFVDHKNTLYLIYDPIQNHFGATKSPAKFLERNGPRMKWCEECDIGYTERKGHTCSLGVVEPKKYVQSGPCLKCGFFGKHSCELITCRFCSTIYKKGNFDHRCILFKSEKEKQIQGNIYNLNLGLHEKGTGIWVYDLESRMEIVQTTQELITEFKTTDGIYEFENVASYDFKQTKHVANMVVFQNVFTNDDPIVYFGEDCLDRFLAFMMNVNGGDNICIAHNAAGYDTRLIFDAASKYTSSIAMNPIMRGGKFMQLTINKDLIFRDSLLHVKGSLRNLAKEFSGSTPLLKGHFPHLFNSIENYSYFGPIPDKKYFDLSFIIKNEKDLEEFNEWYNSFTGEWNFKKELESYCINDVKVLANIVKGYHEIAFQNTGQSPWFNATAPSFVHQVILLDCIKNLELPDQSSDEYSETIQRLAREDFWAVLKPSEYWFARLALRGGRTEIRNVYHTVTPLEAIEGKTIAYQDICSQYPYQQVVHDFPTGTPTIHVFDHKYHPCIQHQNSKTSTCSCQNKLKDRFLDIIDCEQWTAEQILSDPDFFGIVCATLIPPKDLYHPVLVSWNEEANKSFASLRDEDHVEITITSVEFITALKKGYRLKKLFRYDRYKKSPSLWRDKILEFFIEKMINSRKAPEGEELEKMVHDYEQAFGIGDEIMKTINENRWGKNPAKKQTAKIMMNSAWGKHAQRAIMPEAFIFNHETDTEQISDLFQNLSARVLQWQSSVALNETTYMYKVEKMDNASPDLHNGYLPAALFVPAYGRMQLWNELDKLGDRVLMNDTDSIVYVRDPAGYNIPEGGLLGQWELEDIDKKCGGIKTFVGIGPKTYAIQAWDGSTIVKAKGLSLNHATSKAINFETMQGMIQDYLEAGYAHKITVPQQTFTWSVENGMRTWKMLKDLKFNFDDLKGELRGSKLYPFGHE